MVTLRSFHPGSTSLAWEGGRLLVVKQSTPAVLAREAEALQALADCPGIPQLVEHSSPGQLIRTYVDGRPLESLLREGPIPRSLKALWLERLGQLLKEIHQRGHWHGDLSPQNIIITPEQQVALVDWGDARWGTPPYSQAGLSGPDSDWHAYKILHQELDAGSVARDAPRLVGRDPQLQRLRQSWQEAPFRESTWIGVSAPSGAGKTALLREMLWWTPHWAWGQASTMTTPVTYNVFHSLLDRCDWPLSQLGLEESLWRQLQVSFPILRGPSQAVQGSASTMLLLEAWTELLLRQAFHLPLLLVIDDIQWMDESSSWLLQELSRRSIPGLMVVLAWRSDEFTPPDGLRLDSLLELPPLRVEHVQTLSQREGLQLNPSLSEQVTEWTQGNALLISEWLRQPHGPQFSGRVGLLLHQRVAQIPPEMAGVLQVAALLGKEFELAPLSLASPQPQLALDWAQAQQLLLPGLRFAHDQVREAVLAQITPEQRLEWHRRLGEYYQNLGGRPQPCAFHFWQAGQRLQAAPFAREAARLEQRQGALPSAAYFYEICCQVELQPQVVVEYAQVLHLLGNNEKARDWLQRATRQEPASPWMAELLWCLSRTASVQADKAGAYALARQAWQYLRWAPPDQAREVGTKILTVMSTVCHEGYGGTTLLAFILPRIPWMLLHYAGDCVLHANLLIALGHLFPERLLRGLRLRVFHQIRRQPDRLVRAQAINRLFVFRFAQGDGRFHCRMLTLAAGIFEEHGLPWECSMAHMQMGFYAAARGDFAELNRLAQRIQDLTRLGQDKSLQAVALYFETVARGARVAWQRLDGLNFSPKSSWFTYVLVSKAIYRLRQSRAHQALNLLKGASRISPMPVERAMFFACQASAARQAAESTPRRWRNRRNQLFQEARQAAHTCLGISWGKVFHPKARREMALSLLGLGQAQTAALWLEQSVEEARSLGALYEEALSLQAWARLGFPQRAQDGCQRLERLGAWWDLAPSSPGLPLEEVGQAARQFLSQPTPESRAGLERWTGSAWVSLVEETRQRQQSLHTQVLEANRILQNQLNRWQSFMLHGPVAVGRFANNGDLLEGRLDPQTNPVRVDLEGGEYALLSLPVGRSQFSQCTDLIEAEMADLARPIGRNLECARQLPAGRLQTMLVQECQQLQNWHLGLEPVSLPEAWFARDRQIREEGTIPWDRLGPQSRAALANILREAITNAQRHASGDEILVSYRSDPEQLEVRVSSPKAQPTGQPGPRSFGLQSMRFRASLVGGSLSWTEDYTLQLSLPLAR